MSDGLKIDTVALRSAGARLRSVAVEFDGANAKSDTVADAVGHAGLRDAIREFAHGWDDSRADLVSAIGELADACTGIGEGFEDLDAQFAAALRGEG